MGSLEPGIRSLVRWERLSGAQRALLRSLQLEGGQSEAGYAALSDAIGVSLRTVEMSVPRLQSEGWLLVQRRRRLPAVLRLSPQAREALNALAAPASSGAATALRPAGFLGDPTALRTAQMIVGMRPAATDRDLAIEYLERAAPHELSRLEMLRDEDGIYPTELTSITGDARLDFGLRDHFEAVAARHRRRRSTRAIFGLDE